MTLADIVKLLDQTFCPEFQEEYDNSGFLLGDPCRDLTGVLVALDLTDKVLEEAVSKNLNLIVTHHPFIFGGLKHITPDRTAGRLALRLAEQGIAAYAAHTNLDNLKAGVNGILAATLGLEHCEILRPLAAPALAPSVGAGMVGDLPDFLPTPSFLAMVKEVLHLQTIRINIDALDVRPSIRRVAICGGAGAFLLEDAVNAKADIFLTGDLKYHDFQKTEQRIVLADIGHYESEQLARGLMAGAIDALVEKYADQPIPVCITTVCDRWEGWL